MQDRLPRYVSVYHNFDTEGTHMFLSGRVQNLLHHYHPGGGLMARKTQKCPHFSKRRTGKWVTMACTLPAGGSCPDPRCQANPDYQEPEPDAGE